MKKFDQINNNRIELLSPAGSWDSLVAAVQNGADAVYLGGKSYSARQNAENFDAEMLLKAINYAHLRDVRVYLTMNTLISDAEMENALKSAQDAYEKGIDGIIVQDIGFARLLKQTIPEIELHASTQMTVYDSAGVRELMSLGFKRIVLARELSIADINSIYRETDADLEVFIHGALCISYSGQCLFSSMIGGRSGNRGSCAQPCRLPYKLYEKDENGIVNKLPIDNRYRYIMSPKDLCGIELLPQVIKSGVKSLKIEGRMKTPEYVAVVTGIYRKYIDIIEGVGVENNVFESCESEDIHRNFKKQINKEDINKLTQIFNRGGFTKGYLNGEKGKDIMSYEKPKNWGIHLGEVLSYDKDNKLVKIALNENLQIGDGIELLSEEEKSPGSVVSEIILKGKHIKEAVSGQIVDVGRLTGKIIKGDAVYRTSQKRLNENARKSFEGMENARRPLYGKIHIKEGSVSRLVIKDRISDISIEVSGEKIPEVAIKQAISKERVIEQLKKTGGVPFEFESISVDIDEGITLPVSELNALRRKAFEILSDSIIKKSNKASSLYSKNAFIFSELEQNEKQNSAYFLRNICPSTNNAKELNDRKVELSVCFYTLPQNTIIHELEADIIYLPFGILEALLSITTGDDIKDDIECARKAGKNVLLRLPAIMKDGYLKRLNENFELIYQVFDGIMIGSINGLNIINEALRGRNDRKSAFLVVGDITLNTYNSSTLGFFGRQGMSIISVSTEMSLEQINKLKHKNKDLDREINVKKECIIYGRVPVMTSEYCLKGALVDKCKLCEVEKSSIESNHKKKYFLVDRLGLEFPTLTDDLECRMTIFNSKYHFIEEIDRIIDADIQILRINIVDENIEETKRILNFYNSMKSSNRNLTDILNKKGVTKGHYYRGV